MYSRTGASLGVPSPVKRDIQSAIPPEGQTSSPCETLDHKDKPGHTLKVKSLGEGHTVPEISASASIISGEITAAPSNAQRDLWPVQVKRCAPQSYMRRFTRPHP